MKQGDFTEVAKHYHNYNQACMEYGVRFTLLLENKIFVFWYFAILRIVVYCKND